MTKHFRRFTGLVAAGTYSSTIGLGVPFSCCGRNLAVRRKTLLDAGGYKSLSAHISGDDKQLLQLIAGQKGKIRYNRHRTVFTFPETKRFDYQQKRRFGKVNMSKPGHIVFTILLIAFYLYLPIFIIITLNWQALTIFYAAALFAWIVNLTKHREKFLLLDMLYILIYPYYFIYYTIAGSAGNWKWK